MRLHFSIYKSPFNSVRGCTENFQFGLQSKVSHRLHAGAVWHFRVFQFLDDPGRHLINVWWQSSTSWQMNVHNGVSIWTGFLSPSVNFKLKTREKEENLEFNFFIKSFFNLQRKNLPMEKKNSSVEFSRMYDFPDPVQFCRIIGAFTSLLFVTPCICHQSRVKNTLFISQDVLGCLKTPCIFTTLTAPQTVQCLSGVKNNPISTPDKCVRC